MDSEGGIKENLQNRHQIREQQERKNKTKKDVFIHQKGTPWKSGAFYGPGNIK